MGTLSLLHTLLMAFILCILNFLLAIKSHCLRKPGRAKRWGSANFKDILVMQSLSHMNTNGRGLRNFKCFLSENDHPHVFDSEHAIK